jgi:D-serine deaminase-like pyridoxal phosphate-dependent protein
MSDKSRTAGIELRPHCKTHQSNEIANWFRDFGVTKITVSSFDMAAYFVKAGWQDILVAFPFNPLEIKRLNQLSSNCRISLLLDQVETIESFHSLEKEVSYYIDIDTGYGRTGVKSDQFDQVEKIIQTARLNKKLVFSGFYCHAGHSYKSSNQIEKNNIHQTAVDELGKLKEQFSTYEVKILYGDTPNCSLQTNFRGIDEITPGNFVFYDLFQSSIGSCLEEDIGVAMVCPVVGKYRDACKLVIHGGAAHFSKESLRINGEMIYGKQVRSFNEGWLPLENGAYISALSQEHGIIQVRDDQFDHFSIGDLLFFHPVHSCLTANLMRSYYTLNGENISRL